MTEFNSSLLKTELAIVAVISNYFKYHEILAPPEYSDILF